MMKFGMVAPVNRILQEVFEIEVWNQMFDGGKLVNDTAKKRVRVACFINFLNAETGN